MWNSLQTLLGWLWQLTKEAAGWIWSLAITVYLMSFGSIKFKNTGKGKGAISRIWGFLWPFLVSTEKTPLVLPETLSLPLWHFNSWQKAPFPWGKRMIKLLFFAVPGYIIWKQESPILLALLSSQRIDIASIFSKSNILDCLLSLKLWSDLVLLGALNMVLNKTLGEFNVIMPNWKYSPIKIRLPFGGKTIFDLPEFCRTWTLIGLIGVGVYLVNHFGVELNNLNGDFMDSITGKNLDQFTEVLISVARVMGIFIVISPIYTQLKTILILDWIKFVTRFLLRLYANGGNHYVVALLGKPENAAERIEENAKQSCIYVSTIIFDIMEGVLTLYLFGGILWKVEADIVYEVPVFGHTVVVQHLLLGALLVYSLVGTNLAVLVGRRLIALNIEQKKLGAFFRVGLVFFQKYAEPIAAYRGEQREYKKLWQRYIDTLKNNYAIASWQRNLGFFTGAYGQMAEWLPFVALAPFYFFGSLNFGSISQSRGACREILGALSIIVSRFDTISDLLASVARIGELREALEEIAAEKQVNRPRIKRVLSDELLRIEQMSLFTPFGAKQIVADFNLNVKPGERILLKGASGVGKSSIFRAIEGLLCWDWGSGLISIDENKMLALCQLNYMVDGNLRDQMLYPRAVDVSDAELIDLLKNRVKLGDWLEEQIKKMEAEDADFGTLCEAEKYSKLLDSSPNWNLLSGGELQRLAFARVLVNKPELVLLDEASSAVDDATAIHLYAELQKDGMAILSITHNAALFASHNRVIELLGDGNGAWSEVTQASTKSVPPDSVKHLEGPPQKDGKDKVRTQEEKDSAFRVWYRQNYPDCL